MTSIELFHGTTQTQADNILRNGFKPDSYFSARLDIAQYYADAANDVHEEKTGERDDEIILMVTLDLITLSVDYAAYEEPLSYYRNDFVNSDEEWNDGCENGKIPYPINNKDVAVALDVTACVRCDNAIAPNLINVII